MIYKIRIKGHLDTKWSDWFDGLQINHEKDGTSTLYCPLPDQAALHSILRKIRDLNLQLISVEQVKLDAEDETLANSEGGANACPE
ncbi:hypothetical protein ACFLY4_09240 [Chloroflexota bacterium]